jgi:hypothetical protein
MPTFEVHHLEGGLSLLTFDGEPMPAGGFFLDYSQVVEQCTKWMLRIKSIYSSPNNKYMPPLIISGFQKVCFDCFICSL